MYGESKGCVQRHQPSPSFGSNAARPSCDGAVYVGEVGVIPGAVPRTNLRITTREEKMGLCKQRACAEEKKKTRGHQRRPLICAEKNGKNKSTILCFQVEAM